MCPLDAVGHTNPLLALSRQLLANGHELRFFLQTEMHEKHLDACFAEDNASTCVFGERGEDNGLEKVYKKIPPYEEQDESDQKVGDFQLYKYTMMPKVFPPMLEALKAYEPDLIIYDPLDLMAAIASYLLSVPCVSHLTLPAFNVHPCEMGNDLTGREVCDHVRQCRTAKECNQHFIDTYGFDFLANFVMGSYHLITGLCVCTGIKEFDPGMPECVKEVYGDIDEDCVYVGPMLITKEEGRINSLNPGPKCQHQAIDEPFPYDEMRKHKEAGKKIIYASFGTVAASIFWSIPETPKPLANEKCNGKDYCRPLWGRICEAFGEKDDYVVILATVCEDPEALKDILLPSNFIVRRRCPQLDVLKVADAFITHGGANSMMESINAGVPMLVLPYFADQYENGRTVTREGLGMHHDDPVSDCTTSVLLSEVKQLLEQREHFALNCQRLKKSLEEAGGAKKAAHYIEQYAASFQGHKLPRESNRTDVSDSDAETETETETEQTLRHVLLQRCATNEFSNSNRSLNSIEL